jgi:hypothetical protein
MPVAPQIPRAVARQLGNYVYLYVNPLDRKIFYVGKGKGTRVLAHLDRAEKRAVAKILREIRLAGQEPELEILAHGLPDAETALRIEAAVIDVLGLENLANLVRGWHGAQVGRRPLAQVVAERTRKKANIRVPGILIRINNLYRYGMSDAELYDATRSAWKVGPRREEARYAFAVYEGVVREVYRITTWLRAGTTYAHQNGGKAKRRPGRWEFVGTLAEDQIRDRYINKYVGHLFTQGQQNPISYINIP